RQRARPFVELRGHQVEELGLAAPPPRRVGVWPGERRSCGLRNDLIAGPVLSNLLDHRALHPGYKSAKPVFPRLGWQGAPKLKGRRRRAVANDERRIAGQASR